MVGGFKVQGSRFGVQGSGFGVVVAASPRIVKGRSVPFLLAFPLGAMLLS